MTVENTSFGEQTPLLALLERMAENHAIHSRKRSAIVSGAVAMDTIERYMDHVKRATDRKGRRRGRLETSVFLEGRREKPRGGLKGKAERLALARLKIKGDLTTLAKIAEGYALGGRELDALAMIAFALVRVANDDKPLLRYHRVRSNMGKPLTARQRKHLQSLGIEV